MRKTKNNAAAVEPSEGVKIHVARTSPFAGLADFGLAAAPGIAPAPRNWRRIGREWALTLGFGALSATLYYLLYRYEDLLVRLAELTRQGERIDFIVPILLAFIFSLVHGSFTGQFWNALGLKPKDQKTRTPSKQRESA